MWKTRWQTAEKGQWGEGRENMEPHVQGDPEEIGTENRLEELRKCLTDSKDKLQKELTDA